MLNFIMNTFQFIFYCAYNGNFQKIITFESMILFGFCNQTN